MLFRVAYRGEEFYGSACQPRRRTVEGELRKALREEGFSESITMACRTDKGVSALCNIFYSEGDTDYCTRLTSRLENVWIYAASDESEDMRKCIKHYIYFYEGDGEKTKEVASLFCGTHNFSFFSKPENKSPLRTLRIEVEKKENMLLLHFYSQGFLWGMVRRIVGVMDMVSMGKLTMREIETMFEGKERKHITPAPPQNLLLADIETKAPFRMNPYVLTRMNKKFLSQMKYHKTQTTMYEEMRALLAL